MALELFMKERGGSLLRSPVGDRYVVEMMRETGAVLGGEQSGHLIFMNHSTTGDGILAALQLLRVLKTRDIPLSELATLLTPFPQVLQNVHVERKIPFAEVPLIQEAVREIEAALGEGGRVLLRYSGTEPVARVMVEGSDETAVQQYADELCDVLRKYLR